MKVSVVIPNYNHAPFLEPRIESVLRQGFRDFDVLILDDASTDNSREIIERYVGDRVRFLPNTVNSGSTFAQWNRGIRESTGELVWIAESDDEAEPDFLERMVAMLEAHPSAAFAFCQSVLIDEDGVPFGMALPETTADGRPSRYTRDFCARGMDELRNYLRWQMSPVPNASAVLFRRSFLDLAGPADPSYRIAGDHHLYTRLMLHGDVAYVAAPLNRYRHHRRSVRLRTERDGTAVLERYRLMRELLPCVPLGPAEVEQGRRCMAERWILAACAHRGRLALRTHRAIWQTARSVDPCLARRLLAAAGRHFAASVRRRLGLLPGSAS